MTNELILALVGTLVFAIGTAFYVRGIVDGSIVPHPFSYATWTILIAVNVGIMYNTNGGWGILPAVVQMVVLFAYTIVGIYRFRKISVNWFDYFCLACAVVLLASWWFIGDLASAVFTVIIEFIAFLPSYKKVYLQPYTENIITWVIVAAFPIPLILAMSEQTLSNTLYWYYLIIANGAFAALVWWRQRQVRLMGVKG